MIICVVAQLLLLWTFMYKSFCRHTLCFSWVYSYEWNCWFKWWHFEALPSCFPKQLHRFVLLQAMYKSSNFFPFLPKRVIVCLFYYSHCSVCEMVSLGGLFYTAFSFNWFSILGIIILVWIYYNFGDPWRLKLKNQWGKQKQKARPLGSGILCLNLVLSFAILWLGATYWTCLCLFSFL